MSSHLTDAGTADDQRKVLDDLRRQLGDENGSLIIEIVTLYLSQGRQLITEIDAASMSRDRARVRLLAHSLKGSTSTIGARRLATLCDEIEQGHYPHDRLHRLVEALHTEFDSVSAELLHLVPGAAKDEAVRPYDNEGRRAS